MIFMFARPGFWVAVVSLAAGVLVGVYVEPSTTTQKTALDVKTDDAGLYYTYKGNRTPLGEGVVQEDGVYYQSRTVRH